MLSAPQNDNQPLFSSLAKHQRTHLAATPGCPPHPPAGRNYGGRKLRYRNLAGLKPWQVHMLHAADGSAKQRGWPLNVFLTIYYGATFPGEAAMASTFKQAMKRMGQWLSDNGSRFAFVYVHENPGDTKPNSHLLVHVPTKLRRRFKTRAPDWFDALDGGVRVEPRHKSGRDTRLQYMAKGADYVTCRRYGGTRAKGGQGPVSIKRAGVAQCLLPPRAQAIATVHQQWGRA